MQSTRLTAIRHGETAWNVDTRIQGQLDIGLNELGRWQADQAAQALVDADIDAIYSSDLLRAWDTARSLAKLRDMDVITDVGLRERGFGDFEGHTFAEIEARWPDEAQRWRRREPDFALPGGGESLTTLRRRVIETVVRLAAAHVGQHIAIFSHGGVMDVLYRAATGQTTQAPRTWTLHNAAINRLLWTPEGITLVGWGDVEHLQSAEAPKSEPRDDATVAARLAHPG